MKVSETLQCPQTNVCAELLVVLASTLFQHRCKGSTVHHFKEDPKAVLEVVGLQTPKDTIVVITENHKSDLILYDFNFIFVLGFNELEGADVAVALPADLEDSREAANSDALDDVVELRGVVILELGSGTN